MILQKKRLSFEEIDAQTALELPQRRMLSLVTITNVLNHLSVTVTVKNNNVAVQVCAIIDVLNANIGTALTCTIT